MTAGDVIQDIGTLLSGDCAGDVIQDIGTLLTDDYR